jgi:hypothetical protein
MSGDVENEHIPLTTPGAFENGYEVELASSMSVTKTQFQ